MGKRKPVVTGPGKAAKTSGEAELGKQTRAQRSSSLMICLPPENKHANNYRAGHAHSRWHSTVLSIVPIKCKRPAQWNETGTQWWTKPQLSFEELMQVCTGCAKTKQTRKKPKQNSNQPQQRNKLTAKKPTKKPTPKPNHQKTPTKQNQSTNSNPRKCREWSDFKPAFWPLIGLLWTRIMLQPFPQFLP